MTPSWSKRAEAASGLPNLGLGGTLVTAFVASYFAAKAAGILLIIITQGWHAFFSEGLRLKDWKHGIMSNGEPLSSSGNLGMGLAAFIIWMSFLLLVEWLAGFAPPILARCGSWGFPAARLIGGTLLVSLSLWFYSSDAKFQLIHPVPLSALIGGIVLSYRGVVSVVRHIKQWMTDKSH